jgi:hypothetical protein
MLNSGCPERQHGEPTTLPQLKLYWHSLRRQSNKHMVMVVYPASNSSPDFSTPFLAALSRFEGAIGLVTDATLSASLPTFSPSQPGLSGAILGWIRATIAEQ